MQDILSNNENYLDDCLTFLSHRLINLEARFTGPLSSSKPNSPHSEKLETSDQPSMEKLYDCSSEKNVSQNFLTVTYYLGT